MDREDERVIRRSVDEKYKKLLDGEQEARERKAWDGIGKMQKKAYDEGYDDGREGRLNKWVE